MAVSSVPTNSDHPRTPKGLSVVHPSHRRETTDGKDRMMNRTQRLAISFTIAIALWVWQWWAPFAPSEGQWIPLSPTALVVGAISIVGIAAVMLRITHPNNWRKS